MFVIAYIPSQGSENKHLHNTSNQWQTASETKDKHHNYEANDIHFLKQMTNHQNINQFHTPHETNDKQATQINDTHHMKPMTNTTWNQWQTVHETNDKQFITSL